MAELSGKTEEQVAEDLAGVIFKNPVTKRGKPRMNTCPAMCGEAGNSENLRRKPSEYEINVQALERVQPKDLDAVRD